MNNSKLTREICPMPDFVKKALIENNLMEKYLKRPPYQQNDYMRWITQAKRQETKHKRLDQMLSELMLGNKYMKMDYRDK